MKNKKTHGNHLWSLQSDWPSATWIFSFSEIAQFFLALNHHCYNSRHACSVKNRIISALYHLVSVSNTMWRRQLFASAFQKIGFLIDKIFRVLTEICNFKMAVIRDWSKSVRGGGGGPEHLEMWLIKNTWPTPSLRHKNDWPTPKARLEITWPTP